MRQAFYDFEEDHALLTMLEEFIDEISLTHKNCGDSLKRMIENVYFYNIYN